MRPLHNEGPSVPGFTRHRAELANEGNAARCDPVPSAAGGLLRELPPPGANARGWPWDVETPPRPEDEDGPEIFIAMPSFRQGRYIEEALRSVLLQNYPRLRLAVCDAGSNDGTEVILARYARWISFQRIAPDRGQSHALNLAFSLAPSAGLQGFLNSDDLLLPGALRTVARKWRDSNADFIYGNGLSLEDVSGRLSLDIAGCPAPSFRRYPGLVFSHAAFWSSHLSQPFHEELHGALDYEYWVRLLPRARKRRYVSRPLGVMRLHPASKSCDPAQRSHWERDATINGTLHPHLYGPDPLRSRLHRITQRLVRRWRRGRARNEAAAVCREAGWKSPEQK